jgi:hypothetical protein
MDKITVEIAIDGIDEIIEALDQSSKNLYWHQQAAKDSGDNGLRNKLLTRFMTVQDLLSLFEGEKHKIEAING